MANVIQEKSFTLALMAVALYQHLAVTHREFVLSKQLVRSATSVGANVTEAQDAQSRADFISKMSIALKEAKESRYWLELLLQSGYIAPSISIPMHQKTPFVITHYQKLTEEVVALPVSIVKTTRNT